MKAVSEIRRTESNGSKFVFATITGRKAYEIANVYGTRIRSKRYMFTENDFTDMMNELNR